MPVRVAIYYRCLFTHGVGGGVNIPVTRLMAHEANGVSALARVLSYGLRFIEQLRYYQQFPKLSPLPSNVLLRKTVIESYCIGQCWTMGGVDLNGPTTDDSIAITRSKRAIDIHIILRGDILYVCRTPLVFHYRSHCLLLLPLIFPACIANRPDHVWTRRFLDGSRVSRLSLSIYCRLRPISVRMDGFVPRRQPERSSLDEDGLSAVDVDHTTSIHASNSSSSSHSASRITAASLVSSTIW